MVANETAFEKTQPLEYKCFSAYRERPPSAPRRPPIQPLKEHRELRCGQLHLPVLGRRPNESSALKTLGKQPRSLTVPPDDLDHVASTTAEGQEVIAVRVGFENPVHLCRKTTETPGACLSPRALSLTALMEPPMFGCMEPLTGADLCSRTV